MPELSEQEKLERRRQKRQQRILASAENRLNRITGTAFPNRVSPTPSPSTSASSIARSETPQRELPRSRSPSPAVFASTSTESLRSRKLSTPSLRLSEADPSEELGAPPPLSLGFSPFSNGNEPSLENMFAAAGAAGDNNMNFNYLFANSPFPLNPSLLAHFQQQQQAAVTARDTSVKYWNLLHFVSMIWLGIYAVYTEWTAGDMERFAQLLTVDPAKQTDYPSVHFPLFWYFVTLELLLQSARMLYQQGNTSSSNPILASLVPYLPPPLANVANIILRYWIIFSSLVKDCLVLVFIIGFSQIISGIMVGS